MKVIAERYIDTFSPGDEIPSGRYDKAMLRRLLEKGHVAEVAAPEPKGKAAPEPKGMAAPEPKGKAAPEPKGMAAPEPKGTGKTE